MSGIPNSQLTGLLATTLANLPMDASDFETALDLQNYPVCDVWFRTEKMQLDGGTQFERRIQLDNTGNAKHVRLYEKRAISVADNLKTLSAPWCQADTYWATDRREVLRNTGSREQIIDLVKVRRIDAMVALANLLELDGFQAPQNAADDITPLGLPYWINHVTKGSTSGGSFGGTTAYFQDGSSSTTVGGIDKALNAKWANWAATYSRFDNGLIKIMRKTYRRMKFRPPTLVGDLSAKRTALRNNSFRIYMNQDSVDAYEDLLNRSNQDLRYDMAYYDGSPLFQNTPIIPTPALDSDQNSLVGATNPIYFINHNKFFPVVQRGEYLRENEPMNDVEQHNVFVVWVDNSYQFVCTNCREGGAVIHQAW